MLALREDYEAHHRPRARERHAREDSKQKDEDSMANLVPSLEKDKEEEEEEEKFRRRRFSRTDLFEERDL